MAAVAEGLVLRCAAATQRDARVLPNHPAVRVDDANGAADEERAVRARLDRRLRRWLFLPSAIEAAVVEGARPAAFDRGRDVLPRGGVHPHPGPPPLNEHLP